MNPHKIGQACLAVFLFCVASSATYVVNDIRDIEHDKLHPQKSKSRPLAKGSVTVPSAYILLLTLYGILFLGWWVAPQTVYIILVYLILNLAYTFFLKNQPVLDIFTIAIGFVLRVFAGATALNVLVSSWTFITTLCLTLYLAAIKRRQELYQRGVSSRKVLEKYSVALIDRYAQMAATGALMFYSLFVMSERPELIITIPLVIFGLFRYWYVVESKDGGESPTDALISDVQLVVTVLLWILICVLILWPKKG